MLYIYTTLICFSNWL